MKSPIIEPPTPYFHTQICFKYQREELLPFYAENLIRGLNESPAEHFEGILQRPDAVELLRGYREAAAESSLCLPESIIRAQNCLLPELEDIANGAPALAGHKPHTVALEVLERRARWEMPRYIATSRALQNIYHYVVLDDVNLSPDSLFDLYLVKPDKVKIDLAVVALMDSRRIRSLLGLFLKEAVRLRLPVILEGLETDAMVRQAILLGGRYFQGFAPCLHKPEPAASAVKRFEGRFPESRSLLRPDWEDGAGTRQHRQDFLLKALGAWEDIQAHGSPAERAATARFLWTPEEVHGAEASKGRLDQVGQAAHQGQDADSSAQEAKPGTLFWEAQDPNSSARNSEPGTSNIDGRGREGIATRAARALRHALAPLLFLVLALGPLVGGCAATRASGLSSPPVLTEERCLPQGSRCSVLVLHLSLSDDGELAEGALPGPPRAKGAGWTAFAYASFLSETGVKVAGVQGFRRNSLPMPSTGALRWGWFDLPTQRGIRRLLRQHGACRADVVVTRGVGEWRVYLVELRRLES